MMNTTTKCFYSILKWDNYTILDWKRAHYRLWVAGPGLVVNLKIEEIKNVITLQPIISDILRVTKSIAEELMNNFAIKAFLKGKVVNLLQGAGISLFENNWLLYLIV